MLGETKMLNKCFPEQNYGWPSRCKNIGIHKDSHRGFIEYYKIYRNQIVFTIFQLIWYQTEVRLEPNQLEKCNIVRIPQLQDGFPSVHEIYRHRYIYIYRSIDTDIYIYIYIYMYIDLQTQRGKQMPVRDVLRSGCICVVNTRSGLGNSYVLW